MVQENYERLTVVYDLETSGFRGMPMFSYYHKILQICAKSLETNKTFMEFANPHFRGIIPPQSTHVHKIFKADVVNAKPIDQVLRQMYEFFEFEKYTVVELIAHNNEYFDKLIIMKEYKNLGVDEVPANVVFWDTLPWLRANYQGLKSYRLEDLYQYFYKEKISNAHRADADVDALVRIYNEKIAPKRVIGVVTEEEMMFKLVYDTCLTSIRYVGPARANKCFYEQKIQTSQELKDFAESFIIKGNAKGFDLWLIEKLRIKDITHRMFIVSFVYDIPIWFDEIFNFLNVRHGAEDCISSIDYYVKKKYVMQTKEYIPHLYYKGMIDSFNEVKQSWFDKR